MSYFCNLSQIYILNNFNADNIMTSYKQKKEKYVDLKINGRLFPSWILANFKAYKLPDMVKSDDDPCFRQTKLELRKYQMFLSKYLDFNSPFKNILIYHGVGSGKTGFYSSSVLRQDSGQNPIDY